MGKATELGFGPGGKVGLIWIHWEIRVKCGKTGGILGRHEGVGVEAVRSKIADFSESANLACFLHH